MTPEQLCTAVVARLTEITPFIAPTVSHTEQSGDSTDWLDRMASLDMTNQALDINKMREFEALIVSGKSTAA